jgi:hypothetical protein
MKKYLVIVKVKEYNPYGYERLSLDIIAKTEKAAILKAEKTIPKSFEIVSNEVHLIRSVKVR